MNYIKHLKEIRKILDEKSQYGTLVQAKYILDYFIVAFQLKEKKDGRK
ncbi:MAG: hypothetical protein WC169_12500 [Dehalococcoidia bacterium]|jgi:hypothetical protein